ncbi:MAG: hypothetical protein P4L41_17585 [Flavipsychrobacter sp.]|nr:hypothetical protein [Flavipsychrobacter sp.]
MSRLICKLSQDTQTFFAWLSYLFYLESLLILIIQATIKAMQSRTFDKISLWACVAFSIMTLAFSIRVYTLTQSGAMKNKKGVMLPQNQFNTRGR